MIRIKANNGKGNNPSRDEWETPKWLFDILDNQYNFKFDCCANAKNTKCEQYTENFDFSYIVKCMAWMNPPFSKAYKMFCCFIQNIEKGVAIYRCDNLETKLWQKLIFLHASWIFIPDKRIAYEGMEGSGSRFPSALIGFNVPKPIGLKGILLEVIKDEVSYED